MKHLFFVFTFFVQQRAMAQIGPAELMGGNNYLHYQHSLGQALTPNSKFGWSHITTFIKRYRNNPEKSGQPDELMNQGYLTYQAHSLLSIKGGLFYTNVGGYQPTVGVQFFWQKKVVTVLINPRIDIAKNGAYEMFALLELTPQLTKSTKLYTRLQAMSNVNKKAHNRSYQQARVGIDVKGFQFGGGLTLDEYGPAGGVHFNGGIFVRRMF